MSTTGGVQGLSHQMQQYLKKLLLVVLKEEKRTEQQRQILAKIKDFNPYLAFYLIADNRMALLTSIDLLKFLRKNGIEEASEADCYAIIKYFDSDGDGLLSFSDFQQILLPCDDLKTRDYLARRPQYLIEKNDSLSEQAVFELSKLLEREIEYNRKTEEVKQRIESQKSFDYEKAYYSIDDWNYGYVDKRNMKRFLKKHGFMASDADVLTIIRRMDLDADARLSKQEFFDAIKPDEPYSKMMKRKIYNENHHQFQQPHHQRQKTPTFSHSRNQSNSRNETMIQFTDPQKDTIRIQALDRSISRQKNNKSPLKKRPIINRLDESFRLPQRVGQESTPVKNAKITTDHKLSKSVVIQHRQSSEAENPNNLSYAQILSINIESKPAVNIQEKYMNIKVPINNPENDQKFSERKKHNFRPDSFRAINRSVIENNVSSINIENKNSLIRALEDINDQKKAISPLRIKQSPNQRSLQHSHRQQDENEGYNSIRGRTAVQTSSQNISYVQAKPNFTWYEEREIRQWLSRAFLDFIGLEKECENLRLQLCLKTDFNLIDAFGMLDVNGKGFVTPMELRDTLFEITKIQFTSEEMNLFFDRYNKEKDGKIKYSDFTEALMPFDEHYSRLQGMKRMQYLYHNTFSMETMRIYVKLWELLVMNERAAESIKERIYQRYRYQLKNIFSMIDIERDGYLTMSEIRYLLKEVDVYIPPIDYQYLLNRFDRDKDCKISFEEFENQFMPRISLNSGSKVE